MAWRRSQTPRIIPIVGVRKAAQLADVLASCYVILQPRHQQSLDEVSGISLGFPHDFLQSEQLRGVIHGDTFDRMDRPMPPPVR